MKRLHGRSGILAAGFIGYLAKWVDLAEDCSVMPMNWA
jgi:hypothetical protein